MCSKTLSLTWLSASAAKLHVLTRTLRWVMKLFTVSPAFGSVSQNFVRALGMFCLNVKVLSKSWMATWNTSLAGRLSSAGTGAFCSSVKFFHISRSPSPPVSNSTALFCGAFVTPEAVMYMSNSAFQFSHLWCRVSGSPTVSKALGVRGHLEQLPPFFFCFQAGGIRVELRRLCRFLWTAVILTYACLIQRIKRSCMSDKKNVHFPARMSSDACAASPSTFHMLQSCGRVQPQHRCVVIFVFAEASDFRNHNTADGFSVRFTI